MRTDSGTLRLDPRFPVVWRSPTCLQIGVDRPRAHFARVSPAEEQMIHALTRGVSVEGLRMIGSRSHASERSVARLLARVAPALVGGAASSAEDRPLAGRTIALCGGAPARAIARLLGELGAVVLPAAEIGSPTEPADLALIASSWFTPPPEAAVWMQRDLPHVDVVFSDTEVTVGPFVTPGAGACLHCRERFRIDSDDSWPAIAGQLLGRPAPTEVPLTIARVVPLVASFCIDSLRGGASTAEGLVLHVDAVTGEVSESRLASHPECACRALPGTSMAPWSGSGTPRSPPTTAAAAGGPG
ncbi:hypothetical protein B7R22_10370 [Subtercola boreus]|uniref:THIF-type NAD/FAD binding fold domain-containing protein n=1 Tax=Subtercola boreus TaxID=120213 RepID=A0A3E0VWD4_9MICO|nr:hypothetical protein B7R22_10370 [Subtercola boreus]